MTKWQTYRPEDRPRSFAAAHVDYEVVNGHVVGVTLLAGSDMLRITRSDGYSGNLQVMGLEPPKVEVRWRVKGKALGLDVLEYFERQHEADERAAALRLATSSDEDVSVKAVDVTMLGDGSSFFEVTD